MSKRKRHDNIDTRLSQRAVDLFRLGKHMLARGYANDSTEFYEVCRGLHRALQLRPWMPNIFDFEIFDMKAESFPPHADFAMVQELHRRLRGGDGVRGSELAPFYYIKSGTARCLLNVRFPA
jgi:hypothetical protein